MRREAKRSYSRSAAVLDTFRVGTPPSLAAGTSQLCTSGQFAERAYVDWCRELAAPPVFHRKQWEFVFILQCARKFGRLQAGRRAVGLGCGSEPLPAVFAKHGVDVLASDQSVEAAEGSGWIETRQHAADLNALYWAGRHIVSRERFLDHVSFRVVDMNALPTDLGSFDVVWSACALEHLGSLRHGLDFIIRSAELLAPGGIAVHTTEFNLSSDADTLETPGLSVYRKRDIEVLSGELAQAGFELMPVNFNCGDMAIDEHVDLPPYSASPHLKLMLKRYAVTSIGLIVRRMRAA